MSFNIKGFDSKPLHHKAFTQHSFYAFIQQSSDKAKCLHNWCLHNTAFTQNLFTVIVSFLSPWSSSSSLASSSSSSTMLSRSFSLQLWPASWWGDRGKREWLEAGDNKLVSFSPSQNGNEKDWIFCISSEKDWINDWILCFVLSAKTLESYDQSWAVRSSLEMTRRLWRLRLCRPGPSKRERKKVRTEWKWENWEKTVGNENRMTRTTRKNSNLHFTFHQVIKKKNKCFDHFPDCSRIPIGFDTVLHASSCEMFRDHTSPETRKAEAWALNIWAWPAWRESKGTAERLPKLVSELWNLCHGKAPDCLKVLGRFGRLDSEWIGKAKQFLTYSKCQSFFPWWQPLCPTTRWLRQMSWARRETLHDWSNQNRSTNPTFSFLFVCWLACYCLFVLVYVFVWFAFHVLLFGAL